MKIHKIFLAAVLAISSLSLAACANNGNKSENGDKPRVLRVANMTGQPDQYADYIGIEQGIFEKYGIDVQTTEFVAGINTIDSVVTGTADTGLLADFAAANRFGNTLHATNLVIFSDLSAGSSNNGGIYVAPKYANDTASLDGSEGWITNIGTVSEYYNWQAQTFLGLDPAKQKSIQADSSLTRLALAQNGGASAAVVTGSEIKRFEEQGWVKVADSNDVGINVYAYLITTKEFAEANTELLADYLKALKESFEYINANLDESAEKISGRFGIDADDFKSNWKQLNLRSGLAEDGAAHLSKIKDWAFENGKFPEDYNIRQFYYTKAAKAAFPDEVTVDLSSVK
ncbi:MAG: ABC transporter substrate-binding protein [Oscillospiraceae bacterium]|nr:ABC transporter substrate-binding protein [Oscillospiraceae bacterium]